MSNETKKASNRRKNTWLYNKIFSGYGIDIGCGSDILNKEQEFPNIIQVDPFDIEHGDAQYINQFVHNQYDFVYSSQCLEHMYDPFISIKNWWSIVKPGGYLILSVPDEDLYEQGIFPSRWNTNYDYSIVNTDQTRSDAEAFIEVILKKENNKCI